ncbi:hypothetical protein [Cellulosimicrobium arenosum]|uniref:Uncharacterized protein n=1 Tax=Cellulosimicrobium arenosum TaxID=2708133 RepID=A0A927G8X0_9MICO|nr:hypothetical protein [Cellulosimicrobium arenosum]MBD8078845.1 hypothetical protein [Cellulosimicrobium arenosum]
MIGSLLLALGGVVTSAARRVARARSRSTGAHGMAVGCGMSLIVWGGAFVVVGCVTRL